MRIRDLTIGAAAIACAAAAAPSPRDILLRAGFLVHDKAQALALVNDAERESAAQLAAAPGDREAALQHALAIGYRGQLRQSPSDAKATRDALTALAKAYPRDPEVLIAYAGWHLTAIDQLGPFLARTLLGADRAAGLSALDRAVALGGNRAFFPAFAALIRIRLDPKDLGPPTALADRAAAAAAPTPLDRVMKVAAQRLAVPLHAGDGRAAAALAKQLLPFGAVS